MSTPVTRAELKEELKNYPTKAELKAILKEELENYPTKAELKQELERFATKAELKQELERFATKMDLETWGGALLAHIDTWGATLRDQISKDIARFTKAHQESMQQQVSVIDEKYKDLPGRVNRLEATVFPRKRR